MARITTEEQEKKKKQREARAEAAKAGKPDPIQSATRGTTRQERQAEADVKSKKAGIAPRPIGAVETETEVAQAEAIKAAPAERERKAESLAVAEEAGVFEEQPVSVELSPTEEELFRKGEAAKNVENSKGFIKSVTGEELSDLSKETGMDEQILADLIQNPETQRQILLQEIQREELDQVSTTSQGLGTLLEPIIGDLTIFDVDIGGAASKFVRMPKQEVEQIVEQIKEVQSKISGMTDSVSQGEMGSPNEAIRTIAAEEEKIFRYEARIKRLIIESAELRANPEQVNIIEEQLLAAKTDAFEAKQRAGEGALLTPSSESLFFRLQEVRDGK